MKVGSLLNTKEVDWYQLSLVWLVSIPTAVLFGWILVPSLISWQILQRTAISPEANLELYTAWLEPPVPIYLKVYLFNCTNAEEVEKGMVPAFRELGPYVFQEKRTKTNVTLDDSNDTATYLQRIRYHFRKDLSGSLRLEDVLTLINVPFAGAAIKIDRDFPWPVNHVAHTILLNYKEPLFINRTVEETLFKGWKVPFLEKMDEEFGVNMLKDNKFSYLMELNDTDQGPYTIDRGQQGDKSLYGQVIKYKNETSLNFWGDRNSYCNQIYGSDGSLFPPFIGKDFELKLFSPEACRSMYFTYHDTVKFADIQGFRFTAPRVNDTPEEIMQANTCFCPDNDVSKCLKFGAADMGNCRDGAPVAISTPHFYGDADPEYLEQIEGGWKPSKEKHETYIDVEPLTGVVIRASKKLQVNLILRKVKSIKSMRKVRDMAFPLFWADECGYLDVPTSNRLKDILFQINIIEFCSKLVAVLIAIITPLLAFIICTRCRSNSSDKYRITLNKQIVMESLNDRNSKLANSSLLMDEK